MKQSIITTGVISIFAIFFLSTICTASNIAIGDKLPELEITKIGECVIKDADTEYVPWHSSCLTGKVQLVEYVAARQGIRKVNGDFLDALKSENLSDQVPLTQLINANDALWGTSKLVAPNVSKSKKENPQIRYVVDYEGLGLNLWGLTKKTASMSILDPQGTVLYFKEGGMNAEDIKAALEIIKKQLAGGSSSQAASMK